MLSRPARGDGFPAGFSSVATQAPGPPRLGRTQATPCPISTPISSTNLKYKGFYDRRAIGVREGGALDAAWEVEKQSPPVGEERLWRRLRAERMTSENVAGFATCELTKEDPQVASHYSSDQAFEPSHIFARNSERSAAERANRPGGFVSHHMRIEGAFTTDTWQAPREGLL